jgi:phage terminase small subunit
VGGERINLTPNEEAFALAYVAGNGTQGNGTASYLHAYPNCSSKTVAGSAGSRLLKRDRVQARIRELRQEAAATVRDRLRSWWDLAPEAQATLERAAAGTLPAKWSDERIRSAVKSAQYIIDRCEGRPELRGSVQHTGGFAVLVAGPSELRGLAAGGGGDESRRQLTAGARSIAAASSIGSEP